MASISKLHKIMSLECLLNNVILGNSLCSEHICTDTPTQTVTIIHGMLAEHYGNSHRMSSSA